MQTICMRFDVDRLVHQLQCWTIGRVSKGSLSEWQHCCRCFFYTYVLFHRQLSFKVTRRHCFYSRRRRVRVKWFFLCLKRSLRTLHRKLITYFLRLMCYYITCLRWKHLLLCFIKFFFLCLLNPEWGHYHLLFRLFFLILIYSLWCVERLVNKVRKQCFDLHLWRGWHQLWYCCLTCVARLSRPRSILHLRCHTSWLNGCSLNNRISYAWYSINFDFIWYRR